MLLHPRDEGSVWTARRRHVRVHGCGAGHLLRSHSGDRAQRGSPESI